MNMFKIIKSRYGGYNVLCMWTGESKYFKTRKEAKTYVDKLYN